eukprot:scaffold19795_cov62-Skeletonema_dohrnii-CCMP3373.AAC.1
MPLCDDYNNGECLGVENGQNGDYASEDVGECEWKVVPACMPLPMESTRTGDHAAMSSSSNYPEDYDRLCQLKSDTLGGEIMRAVNEVASNPQGSHRLAAINFLTKFGVISKDENDLYAKLVSLDENKRAPTEEIKSALEMLTDRAVALLLAHPDLEFIENEDTFAFDGATSTSSTTIRKSARNLRKAPLKSASSFSSKSKR